MFSLRLLRSIAKEYLRFSQTKHLNIEPPRIQWEKKKKKQQRKIGESVKLTPNTVFSGLGDTEAFFRKKKVLLKQISFKYLFLFSGTSAITQLKSRSVAVRKMLHHLAACCTQEVVLFPLCLY